MAKSLRELHPCQDAFTERPFTQPVQVLMLSPPLGFVMFLQYTVLTMYMLPSRFEIGNYCFSFLAVQYLGLGVGTDGRLLVHIGMLYKRCGKHTSYNLNVCNEYRPDTLNRFCVRCPEIPILYVNVTRHTKNRWSPYTPVNLT